MQSLALLASALLASTSLAQDIARCGAPSPPTDLKLALPADALNKASLSTATFNISTYIHIITSQAKKDLYPPSMVASQIDVMNESYNASNIQFVTKEITYTVNDVWAACDYGADCELEYKRKLRKGTYEDLNVFVLSDVLSVLGYCYFPEKVLNETTRDLDGCVVLASTLPGGGYLNFDAGYTAVHEIGHWLGLFHTFQDFSCSGPGDLIDDTPMQQLPTTGCPKNKDSCPGKPGKDPIHNYMDYSYDECLTEFTRLQTVKMLWTYANRRLGK